MPSGIQQVNARRILAAGTVVGRCPRIAIPNLPCDSYALLQRALAHSADRYGATE